jgi:hypothetical protein
MGGQDDKQTRKLAFLPDGTSNEVALFEAADGMTKHNKARS